MQEIFRAGGAAASCCLVPVQTAKGSKSVGYDPFAK